MENTHNIKKAQWLIISVLILGMFICTLLAAIDNFKSDGSHFVVTSLKFITVLFFIILLFFAGAGIFGYENMGEYFAHNLIFYSLLLIIILTAIVFRHLKSKRKL